MLPRSSEVCKIEGLSLSCHVTHLSVRILYRVRYVVVTIFFIVQLLLLKETIQIFFVIQHFYRYVKIKIFFVIVRFYRYVKNMDFHRYTFFICNY